MSSNPNYDSEFCGKVPIHLINTLDDYLDAPSMTFLKKFFI
jgi:hypothetical protein